MKIIFDIPSQNIPTGMLKQGHLATLGRGPFQPECPAVQAVKILRMQRGLRGHSKYSGLKEQCSDLVPSRVFSLRFRDRGPPAGRRDVMVQVALESASPQILRCFSAAASAAARWSRRVLQGGVALSMLFCVVAVRRMGSSEVDTQHFTSTVPGATPKATLSGVSSLSEAHGC